MLAVVSLKYPMTFYLMAHYFVSGDRHDLTHQIGNLTRTDDPLLVLKSLEGHPERPLNSLIPRLAQIRNVDQSGYRLSLLMGHNNRKKSNHLVKFRPLQ
jgi:hypothetical protein